MMADNKPTKRQVKIVTTKVVRLTRDEVAEFSNESGSDSEVEDSSRSSQNSTNRDLMRSVNVRPVTDSQQNAYNRENGENINSRLPTEPKVLRNIPVHYKILPRSVIEVEVCSAIS